MFLGCDPEIFLVDAAGALISSIGLIGGSKSIPRPLFDLGNGYFVQEDNVAIEFNIPPANSEETFIENVCKARDYLAKEVAQLGLNFINSSAESFPETQLNHPSALEFGCEPDFNAWRDGRRNPRPKAVDNTLRSAGGHVHVGYEFGNPEEVITFTQYMDLYLGVPSVLLDKNGGKRRDLYGNPGSFRFKPYGMEYRTLSNFWIFDEKLISWVWSQTQAAMDAWQQNNKMDLKHEEGTIIKAIKNSHLDSVHKLINQYHLQLV